MDYKDIMVLNTLKLGEKEFSIEDSKGFVNLRSEKYQLPTNFYGNQVHNLAKTDKEGIYLCIDRRNKAFNILVKKDEISALEAADIRAILTAAQIAHSKQMPKKYLLSLLGVDFIEADTDPNNAGSNNIAPGTSQTPGNPDNLGQAQQS